MKRLIPALGAALLAVALPSQGKGVEEAKAGFEKLKAEWKAANSEYRATMAKIQSRPAYKKARQERDMKAIRSMLSEVERPDAAAFGERALALADKLEGEDGLPVLTFVVKSLFDRGALQGAVDRISDRYITSPNLGDVLERGMVIARMIGADEAETLLKRVVEENPNAEPKAWALYWQSVMISRDKKATDEEKARAEEMLAEAEKLAGDSKLGDRIRAPKFAEEHLQIGMVAPDIEGRDHDGVEFRLSDYRGKVVVLDFWGFW